jgi:hypothetical protein
LNNPGFETVKKREKEDAWLGNKKAANGRQIRITVVIVIKANGYPPCLSHNAIPHRSQGQVILSQLSFRVLDQTASLFCGS